MVGANRICMDSSDSLWEKMRLPAGTVSIFCLLNNPHKDIYPRCKMKCNKKDMFV